MTPDLKHWKLVFFKVERAMNKLKGKGNKLKGINLHNINVHENNSPFYNIVNSFVYFL